MRNKQYILKNGEPKNSLKDQQCLCCLYINFFLSLFKLKDITVNRVYFTVRNKTL